MTEEEEEEEKDRRTRSIQDIINKRVFTPKFWDLNTPGLSHNFDSTSQMESTRDQFLLMHDLGKDTGRFPTDRMASQRSFVFNQTGNSERQLPREESARFEHPRDAQNFNRTDIMQNRSTSRGYKANNTPNPAFKNAIESTLNRFEKDMDEIFQRKPEDCRSNDQPKGSDRTINCSDSHLSEKTSLFMPMTSAVSTPYGLNPSKCFKKKGNDELARCSSDSEDEVKSARDFMQKLRGPNISKDDAYKEQGRLQIPAKVHPNHLSFRPKVPVIRYREEMNCQYESESRSEDLFKSEDHHYRSPSDLDKLEGTNGNIGLNDINMEHENDEYYMIDNCTSTMGKLKNRVEYRSSVEDQEGKIVSSKLQHNLTSRIDSEVNFMNNETSKNNIYGTKTNQIDLQTHTQVDFESSSPVKIDQDDYMKESNFKSKQKNANKKFAGLNLDLEAISIDEPATPSAGDMSLMGNMGLDTPVMKALNSIQGKIEELNCMMNKSSLQTTGNKYVGRFSNQQSLKKDEEYEYEESPSRFVDRFKSQNESQQGIQVLGMPTVEDFHDSQGRASYEKLVNPSLKKQPEFRKNEYISEDDPKDYKMPSKPEKTFPNSNFNNEIDYHRINKENKVPTDITSTSSRTSKITQQVQHSQSLIDRLKRASDSSHFWQQN